MERHLKLHLVELFAIILLIGIYSLLFIPLVYYIDAFKIIHVVGITGVVIGVNFLYGTFRTWWKHRGHYMPEEEAPNIYANLDALSEEFGTRKPRLVVFDTDVPNAYATDTLPTRPIVALTRGLMEKCEPEELKAVMAHEMSHIRSYDVFFMLFLSSFVNVVEKSHAFTSGFVYNGDDAIERIIFIVPFIITWTNLQIVYMVLFFVSRVREFVADKDAANATGAKSMKDALSRITLQMEEVSEAEQRQFHGESALTIIPLDKFKSKLFSTHPSTDKRIQKLEEIETIEAQQKVEETPTEDNETTTDTNEETSQTDTTDETSQTETTQDETPDEDVEYPTDLSLRGNKD